MTTDAAVAAQREAAAASFRQAAERTHSPSDRLAFSYDAWLVTHPDACAKDADYPGFAEWVAAREADNRRARKETNR
jgi:hypothetical protein